MIVILIISEKSCMMLTICVYDSSNSTLLWKYQQDYHIHKSSGTYNSSLKISTRLSYTQIVMSIQLLVEWSWRFVYLIVMLIISQESWMFLTIYVYDSSVDYFWEELNVFDDLCIQNYRIHKSWRTFKSFKKLSTLLSCTQIVKNIQLFSENINRTDLCIWLLFWSFLRRVVWCW
jgi:hypothetical protein